MNANIAFVGWNPFQFNHSLPLLNKLSDSKFILEMKQGKNVFNKQILEQYRQQIMMVDKDGMGKIDNKFDLIVCQTPFRQIFQIEKAPIVMMQYGYAKEPHNYAPWRSLADVNLVYGRYAANKISYYSPVEITGNPNYDLLQNKFIKAQIVNKYQSLLDNKRKTVLYAPTWGDLSSLDDYLESVAQLSSMYNVIIKVHHNTHLLDTSMWERIKQLSNITLLGADDILLEAILVADVVISDYSGAIFDAMYFSKPVVLLNSKISNSQKMDEYSLEYAYRNLLGIEVNSVFMLREAVEESLQIRVNNQAIREKLFLETSTATDNVISCLEKAVDKEYKLTQNQQYIRNSVKELYETRYNFSQYKKRKRSLFAKIRSSLN